MYDQVQEQNGATPENALKINLEKIATSLKNKKNLKYFITNDKSKFKNITLKKNTKPLWIYGTTRNFHFHQFLVRK